MHTAETRHGPWDRGTRWSVRSAAFANAALNARTPPDEAGCLKQKIVGAELISVLWEEIWVFDVWDRAT